MPNAYGPQTLLAIDELVQRFEKAWETSGYPAIDDFLPMDDKLRLPVLKELVFVDLEWRLKAGHPARFEDYLERYPALAADAPLLTSMTKLTCRPRRERADARTTKLPQMIGRYRAESLLGYGAFGLVFLAYDDLLSKRVAIKVPHPELVARSEDAVPYLTEARTVAALEHPNIVPVYDAGTTAEHAFFIVSKFIEGSTLKAWIKDNRPEAHAAAELIRTVAQTLHFAHDKGLVHRDIKPSNILLEWHEGDGHPPIPYIADFGLALKEEDVGRGPRFAGTPAYMSPEQARGEGNRVDRRSDVFSLGVVFYELLTGERPFHADKQSELLSQIANTEARSPRQWAATIPKALERICLKALAKRASDRYTTAKDMADDLEHFLEQSTVEERRLSPPSSLPDHPIKIVPKGLRSFDMHDADFFLELLPGPRDRDGLPDTIRFWKTHIEGKDLNNPSAVGLIYGPSGCGKSSLVKAGLLPRLSDDVIAVCVEATAAETETRLLNGLRQRCPGLGAQRGLKETLAALRRGQGVPAGKKVLVILDQFEQWLHTTASRERATASRERERPEVMRPEFGKTELVEALRQCDGRRLQCIVMVRDDFWLAISRFFKELEIRLLDGQNSALVDLFDTDHAEKVLAAFGRAFGKLPVNSEETSKEQKQFLVQALEGMAEEGKVICVRLALFAEMMKGKTWTPASLKAVGGPKGVGITFLEETFSAATAPPEHRYHQNAARAVLKALAPAAGTDIKGHMRSYQELLAASGYANCPKEFDDLLRILDSEIRLITPTDPAGTSDSSVEVQAGAKYYQLTHDHLVHSLRDWLTRKQKETRVGRAELLLADRAAVWCSRPENRQLPSFVQWLQISLLTLKKNWTAPERKMMRKATGYHVSRALGAAAIVAAVAVAALTVSAHVQEQKQADHAAHLVRGLLAANVAQLPGIIGEIEPYRDWAEPLLKEKNAQAAEGSTQKLNTSIALLPTDSGQIDYLYGRMLQAEPHEFTVLRDCLEGHKEKLREGLWSVAQQPARGKESQQRLRASSALAAYDPADRRWGGIRKQVAGDLVGVPAANLGTWLECLRPASEQLYQPLTTIFREPKRGDLERSLAADVLADYVQNDPKRLADLLMDADEKQFGVLYARLAVHEQTGRALLEDELSKVIGPQDRKSQEKLAKRQANAAVALLRMNYPEKAWQQFKFTSDPRVRSYLIHRCFPMGVDAGVVSARLATEENVTARRALVLSLGEYPAKTWPADEWSALTRRIMDIYETAPDAGLHGATAWLLCSWNQQPWLKEVDETWAADKERREKTLEDIKNQWGRGASDVGSLPHAPRWYVTGQAQVMAVIPGPIDFLMGSPVTEASRQDGPDSTVELQHQKHIPRSFAIAAKEVTLGQFRRFHNDFFQTDYEDGREISPSDDCPATMVSWYQAAAYCNWLSKMERISENQWCYEKNSMGKYDDGMSFVPGRTGYRLPTEAEWEYACRAGTLTSYYFGASDELLGKYAWYSENARDRGLLPGVPGRFGGKLGLTLKPNDFGLFDMMGNAAEWCHSAFVAYEPGTDSEVHETIGNQKDRVLRGGNFTSLVGSVRSSYRVWVTPSYRYPSFGFRPARTVFFE